MRPPLSLSDVDICVMCGANGAGVIQAPRFILAPYLESGALVEVLPRWSPRPMPITAVYPHNRRLAPKVRVFVDWIVELFEKCPLMSDDVDSNARCPHHLSNHVGAADFLLEPGHARNNQRGSGTSLRHRHVAQHFIRFRTRPMSRGKAVLSG